MSCLLPLIAGACLLDPSHVLVRGDVSYQVSGHFNYIERDRSYGTGKLGRLAVEIYAPLSASFTLNYGIEHTSLYTTNEDRGQERAYVGLTWRPFVR